MLFARDRWLYVSTAAAAAFTFISLAFMGTAHAAEAPEDATTPPITHVVVIFQENRSFDHYFGTYPQARANKDGTTFFRGATTDTPSVNNLLSAGLLTTNPNKVNPFRIDRSTPNTCDQNHDYGPEQAAFHGGLRMRGQIMLITA